MEMVIFSDLEEVQKLEIEEYKVGDIESTVLTEMKDFAAKGSYACLAAPQVGINKRFFVLGEDYFFNPFIEDMSTKSVNTFEVCENFAEKRIESVRYPWIEIAYNDGTKDVTKTFEGEEAQYVQFCMDWLEKSFGGIVETVKQEMITKETIVGRNDPCLCGSGKKYKKCCQKASV